MNTNVHPAMIVVVVAVLVAGIGYWGYKASLPAPYVPSPGLSGASGVKPGSLADGGYGSVPAPGTRPGSKIDAPVSPATN